MKRLCIFLLALMLALAPLMPAMAVSKSIRVGLLTQGGVDTVPADDAHLDLLMDALEELRKYTNWSYTFISGTEEELLMMLSAGVIDVLGGVYHHSELDGMVQFPPYATGYAYALLVADQDDESIQRYDYQSIQGKRIAAVAKGRETDRLRTYLALNNINGILVYKDSQSECLRALHNGEVDLVLINGDSAEGYRIIDRFVVEPYYFAVSPRRTDLYDDLLNAYRLILDTDPDYLENLYQRHFAQEQARNISITMEERVYLDTMPTLKFAVPAGYAPLQEVDDAGNAYGISVDVLRLIASRTGLRVELVPVRSIRDAIEQVRAGQADGVLGLSLMDGSVTENDLVMTRGYIDLYRVVIRNIYVDYPSEGMTLALLPGMEYLVDDFTGEVVYGDSFLACLELVNSGEADYTYGSSSFVEYGTQGRTYHNVQVLTLPGVIDSMGVGLKRPVDPPLLTLMNKGISSITEEEMQDIVLNNTALRDESFSLLALVYAYPLIAILMITVVLLIIVAVVVIVSVQRARHSRELYRTQYTDELTGALNLAGFRREATRLLQTGAIYALSYSSIRSFKYINDRYGFEEGDDVLRHVAGLYRIGMDEGEVFCRANGATFIALHRYTDDEGLRARMARLHAQVAQTTLRADSGYHLFLTTGMYVGVPGEHLDILSRIDRANAARQQIKDSTETYLAFYAGDTYESMLRAQEIESRMESALRNKDFLVYLQPKITLATMKPGGAEALVRWLDRGRLVPPGDFIPQFERNGFIARLDRYMFEQCCGILRRWIDTGMPVVPISINVSRVQLYEAEFVDTYVAIKQQFDIPDGLLELEFTESILFEDIDRLIDIVHRLHAHGFVCSIDDFGKGYSSLTMIKNIPVDILKLDAQFFESGTDGQRDTIIIESVVDIARQLGMTSIAEGIEKREQVTLLQMIGCDMVQGYIFSRPLDVASFEAYLRQKILQNRDPFEPLQPEGGAAT